jgi:hypothetical protein
LIALAEDPEIDEKIEAKTREVEGLKEIENLRTRLTLQSVEAVADANKVIEAFKRSASPARLKSAQNELNWLQLTKKRHEQPLKDASGEYVKLTAEKDELDKKVEGRAKLDTYSTTVVDGYRKSINAFLSTFTAGFHLDKMRVEYSGRVPNSTFCVVINDTHVDMGNSDTPLDEPSFRNTLSAVSFGLQ